MKNRRRQFIKGCILSAGLFLIACQSETFVGEQEENNEPQEYGRAYLSVAVNVGDISTRAENPDWGTVAENKVSTVRMVLYGKNDHLVKYAFDFNIQSVVTNNTISGYQNGDAIDDLYDNNHNNKKDQFVTFARGLALEDYLMLLIINPTEGISDGTNIYKITKVGQTLSLLNDAVNIAAEKLYTKDGNPDYFMMTNHQDLVEVPKELLQPTPSEANENPISIEVSRVVAKVTLDADNSTVTKGRYTDLTWDLDITNSSTYWLRQMTNIFSPTGIAGPKEEMGQDRSLLYAIDPNFDGGGEFNRYSIPNDDKPLAAKSKTPRYCLENTMNAESQQTAVTTRVLIRCDYAPDNITPGTNYYVFGDQAFIQKKMDDYVANANNIPSSLVGLQAAIEAAQLEGYDLKTPNASFESKSGIKYYHKGINYYAIKIRHFADTALGEKGYGYYGVVRNNHYWVTLTEIKGVGSPTVDIGEEGYLAVNFKILKWTDRENSTVLK